MNSNLLKPALSLRKTVTLLIKPRSGYFLATRSPKPLSSKFGFDRGTPIDRYWIEKFLSENRQDIKGKVLEVTDNKYTKTYGENRVTKSDVLDLNTKNNQANIHGDLRDLKKVIRDNTYDCIILTHVLGMIDDLDSAISEIYRILKPGGVVLVTSASMSPTLQPEKNFWRFTRESMKYLFSKKFRTVQTDSFGNVLAGQCFWVGMAKEELTQEQLNYRDIRYQCIVTVRAQK